ncbi:MAG: protein kinase [Chloroflexi bacterium]|nr:protein kinase [Chloroflexota bacterium]
MMPNGKTDLSGRKFGKYQLVERLGRGGMADVYKAYQPGLNRFVAIKLMHGHLADSADFVERFKREAQSVGQLRHPHIVQVIDFDVEDDVYYMVMEFIKGNTLKSYIEQRGALRPEEALRITENLADALSYAHENNMIHRDIKPANVMFTTEAYTHAVLTDFGIARILGEAGLTVSGTMIGTPAYMCPEAGRGESVDSRGDIYSLGIVLFEMLTGRVPFDADTPFAVVMKHVNEPLPPLSQVRPGLPDSIERLLLKALAKDPDERFQTAEEFKQAIQDVRSNLRSQLPTGSSDAFATEPALTKPPEPEPTLVEAPPEPVAKRKFPMRAIGAVIAIIAVIAVVLALASGSDEDGDDSNGLQGAGTSDQLAVDGGETPPAGPTEEGNDVADPVDGSPLPDPMTQTLEGAGGDSTPPQPALTEETVGASTLETAQRSPETGPATVPADGTSDVPEAGAGETITAAPTRAADAGSGADTDVNSPLDNDVRYTAYLPNDDPAVIERANEISRILDWEGGDAALAAVNEALDEYPGDSVLLRIRSELRLFDDPQGALADAETAVDAHPQHPAGYLALANYYFYSEDYDYSRAIGYAEDAYELTPEHWEVTMQYADALWKTDEPERALEMMNQAEELGAPPVLLLAQRGYFYWERGRYDAALNDFARLLEIEEEADTRYFVMGSLMLLDRAEEALEVAREGLETHEDPGYLASVSYVAYRAGEDDVAAEWANTALAFDGDLLSGYYVLALVAARADDYETALDNLYRLEDVEDWRYEWPFLYERFGHSLYLDIARVYQAMGEFDAANVALDQAIENNSSWYLPLLVRARWLAAQGNEEAAILNYLQAIDLADAYDDELALGIVQEMIDAGLDTTTDAVLMLIELEEPQSAVDLASFALETYPDELSLVGLRAMAYLAMGEIEAASADIESIVAAAPDAPVGYTLRAHLLYVTGDYEQMLEVADQAADLGPDDPDALMVYAKALAANGRADEALEAYNQAEAAGADREELLSERGVLALENGFYDQAASDFSALLEILPNAEVARALAAAYLLIGEPEAAFTVAQDNIELAADSEENQGRYLADMAYVAYATGEDATASEWLAQAREIVPESPRIVYLEALLLAREGEFEAAIAALESLQDVETWRYDQPYLNLMFGHTLNFDIARIHRAAGDPEAAREYYERDIPWIAEFYLERARFYIEIGENEVARQDLLEAVDIPTSPETRDEIRQQIVELGPAPASE